MSQRFRAFVSLVVLCALMTPALTARARSRAADTLSGTININLNTFFPQDQWQIVADAYMTLHPRVKVVVQPKPAASYEQYLRAGFAGGTPPYDIVNANQIQDLANTGKFINFYTYLNRPDPYIGGKPWRDAFNAPVLLSGASSPGLLPLLDFETVQTRWFYNKDLFAKVGIGAPPRTFPEWLADCAKIKKAGYIPIAMSGSSANLTGGNGWIFQSVADQYQRGLVQQERSRPGDYTYDPSIDPTWRYDAANPHNDDPGMLTINPLREYAALKTSFSDTPAQAKMDRWRADSLPLQAADQNIHDLLATYTPPGWFGIDPTSAYALFLQGKAAMYDSTTTELVTFDRDIKNLKTTQTKGAAKAFTLGSFYNPSAVGPYVQAPARAIEAAIDFFGVPNKGFAQNQLNVDFLMWLSSPQGFGRFIAAAVQTSDGSLFGPPIVKNAPLPVQLQARFAQLQLRGNYQKAGAQIPGSAFISGVPASEPDYVNRVQQWLSNKITTAQYAAGQERMLQTSFDALLKVNGYAESDLLTPRKAPPKRS